MAALAYKKHNSRRTLATVALLLVLALAAILISWSICSDGGSSFDDLKNQQSEMLQALRDREGEYDESTVVLSNTTKREANDLAERFGAKLRITSDGRFATLILPDDTTIYDIIANDENLKYIDSLSVNWSVKLADVDGEGYLRDPVSPSYNVSDELYPYQNYLDYLNLGDVWYSTCGSNVTVAVIDTGIDTDHPEFMGRISEYSYNASEDKIVKDCVNADGSYDWSIIEDTQGHGTAVAGTIGASMNGKGTVGIASDATILVIKAECDEQGNFLRSSDLVFGLYYAIERDVDVVNMSFGGFENIYENAAKLGRDSDVIMVAAAGNYGTAALMYPAADENVIGVGALADESWELAEYSNYGENTDITAPGTVYTTTMGGEYGSMNGTSFSSPIVAASIALLKSNYSYKYATNADIIELLYASAYDLGDLGPDYYFGYGAIDVMALLSDEQGIVTFDYLTDEIEETEQIFILGNPLQNIPEPERLYAVFEGWYYDIECTEPLDLYRDAFNNDLTLYAKWINEDDGVPYTYVVLDDGTVEIRSYTGHRKYITVPEIIENRIVSSIGDFTFAGEDKLREVQLPDSINHIGLSAFEGCSNLVSVNIPDAVTEIEENTFKDNVRLSYIEIGENSRLKTVGNYAFSGCYRLRTIDLPKTLESINGSAFLGTVSMTKINVDKNNPNFTSVSGVLFNKSKTALVAYPAALSASYTIPDVTRRIGCYAFAYSSAREIGLNKVEVIEDFAFNFASIVKIVIPDSVTTLGNGAFINCANLSQVKIGSGLSDIPSQAFGGSFSLRTIEIPKNIMNIGADAFSFSGIRTIDFADGANLTVISPGCFYYSDLREIDLPKSLVTIGSEAFKYCFNLNRVSFDDGCTIQVIGDEAFSETVSLESISIPESVRMIGSHAFNQSAISGEINISSNLEYFGSGAFASCHNLTGFNVADNNKQYVDYNGVVYSKDSKTIIAFPTGSSANSYILRAGTQTVGESAFEGAANLQRVEIVNGVTEIMPYAFFKCKSVMDYVLPNTLTDIKEYAFAKNSALCGIYIPRKVVAIGKYAFQFDYNLWNVDIADDSEMDRIGFAAFAHSGVVDFEIPANISSIAQYAFEGCNNLDSVVFAKNSKLESISAYMFVGADNLSSIKFESGSALNSVQAHGLEGMAKLRSVDFGDAKVTNIDNYAFRYCASLESLTLPETLENIGRYAFYKCDSLSKLVIPSATEHIGSYAFYGTEKCSLYFTSDYLPMQLDENWDSGLGGYYTGVIEVITDGYWRYATKTNGNIAIIEYLGSSESVDLSKLNLGGKIDTIGGYAFSGSSIKNVILPDSLVEIQRYAFAHTDNLKSVIIPSGVKYIAAYAFVNSAIDSVSFAGDSVEVIEKYAFAFTDNLKSVTLPASVRTVGSHLFYESGLESVSFEKGIALFEIPESAFAGTSLSDVTIPDGITRIRSSAFRDVLSLKSLTFGSGNDLRIDANAFYNTGLESLHIPKNLRYIGEYAFIGLEGLKSYEVDKDNPYYTSVDGVLYSKDKSKLIAFPAGREGSFEIPSFVESIGFGAFENTHLGEVTFAEGINLLTLGWRAFFGAEKITEITLPESLISIDYYAFAGCKNLTAVRFAENNKLKGIYEGAFFGCQRLESITIPDSIVEISEYAFYGCMSLDRLPISDTSGIKGIYDYAFAYTGIRELTLPDSVIDIGKYAFRGSLLEKVYISNANSKVLSVGIGAFENCSNISEITLPFIGESYDVTDRTWLGYIFGAGSPSANQTYTPEGLKTVTILDGVTTVPKFAFYKMSSLESISIPHSVVHIGESAFYECPAEYELTNTISFDKSERPWYNSFGEGMRGSITLDDSVTEIIDHLFYNCSLVENIYIPDSVTAIGNTAFYGCSSLKKLDIPKGVREIGASAFSGCSSLESFTLPEGIEGIEAGLFSGCHSLESVDVPDGIKYIRNNAFDSCYKLKEIYIPDGVTKITSHAFYRCQSLKSVVIPDSVINPEAENDSLNHDGIFSQCTALESVKLSKNMTAINGSMFYGCTSLTDIVIPDGVVTIGDYAFRECESLKKINIPDSVSYVGSDAFYYCYALESVSIPGSVKTMGDMVFRNCVSLKSVSLGEGVKKIGDSAFLECSNLSEVHIPDTVTSIGDWAFSGCTVLENITLPENLTHIGANAFSGCRIITEITLPSSITNIGEHAFFACESLMRVVNNSSLQLTFGAEDNGWAAYYARIIVDADGNPRYLNTHFGDNYYQDENGFLFEVENDEYTLVDYVGIEKTVTLPTSVNGSKYKVHGLSGVVNVIVPEGFEQIDFEAFSGCKTLKSVVLPDGLKYIGGWAFSGCSNLESVNIPDSVIHMSNGVFDWCSSLKEIAIPHGVTELYYSLFSNCSSLEKVTLHDGISDIYDKAFRECSSLKSIDLPENLKNIHQEAFYGCTSLEGITLPDSLESLGVGAFINCSSIEYVNIPDSLTQIGSGAFSGARIASIEISKNHSEYKLEGGVLYNRDYSGIVCMLYGIIEIEIPSDMTEIPKYAFAKTPTLEKVKIPNSVVKIGAEAFKDCTALTEIIIPDSVKIIDGEAFRNCTALKTVTIPDSVNTMGEFVFSGCSALESATVGTGVIDLPANIFSYCSGLKNVKLNGEMKTIGNGAFYDCPSIEAIEIPDSVTEIGSAAFSECSSLKRIELPKSLTKISASLFERCDYLEEITVPDSVTAIERWAFFYCIRLKKVNIGENSKLARIDQSAFYATDITSITIPDTLCEIGESAFAFTEINIVNISENHPYFSVKDGILYNKDFTDIILAFDTGSYVIIPSTITHIPAYAFGDQRSIVYLEIPDSVISIGREAFSACDNIRVVKLGKNLQSIDYYAFSSLIKVHKIINNSSLDLTFGSWEHGKIAEYARSIVDAEGNITYNSRYSDTTYIETEDGFLFELYDGVYTLTAYLGSEKSITLPKDINGNKYVINCFQGGSEVIIPNGFTEINQSAFYGNRTVRSIRIPASVTEIRDYAFDNARKLENIYIDGEITHIGYGVVLGTPFYNNPNNWVDGCLYLDTCLVDVDTNAKSIVVRPDTTSYSAEAFNDCYLLTDLTIGGNFKDWQLNELSNLENLTLTSLPDFALYFGFGMSADYVPITLSKVILKSGCDVSTNYLFTGISDVTIFVEDEKEACPWDEDYAGWNNGNKVIYGGDWHYVIYYSTDGEQIATHYYSISEVIKPPYVYSHKDRECAFEFEGWDVNGDGIADGIPATVNKNYKLNAIINEKQATYTVRFMDKDGYTVLYSYELPYGATIPTPASPVKKGYSFIGWTDIPDKLTEDIKIYSEWLHNGTGHEYSATVIPPTCTEKGYTLHTCPICDESYKSDLLDATGHSYGEWVVINEATCTEDGLMRRECTCKSVQESIIDSDGHDFVVTEREESSCHQSGKVKYLCTECGEKLTENLPLDSHDFEKKYASKSWLIQLIELLLNIIFGYEGDWGYYYECVDCSHIATTEENLSSGTAGIMSTCYHQLGDWVEVKKATCSNGYKARYCTLCNKAVEAAVISAIEGQGHDYSTEWTVDTPPTCTVVGSKSHHCLTCGDRIDVTEISATGHSFTDYISNNDATYTEDGTLTAKCDNCDEMHTKVDIGSALGEASMFEDRVKELVINSQVPATLEELYAALEIYNSLSEEGKAETQLFYEILMNAINSFDKDDGDDNGGNNGGNEGENGDDKDDGNDENDSGNETGGNGNETAPPDSPSIIPIVVISLVVLAIAIAAGYVFKKGGLIKPESKSNNSAESPEHKPEPADIEEPSTPEDTSSDDVNGQNG